MKFISTKWLLSVPLCVSPVTTWSFIQGASHIYLPLTGKGSWKEWAEKRTDGCMFQVLIDCWSVAEPINCSFLDTRSWWFFFFPIGSFVADCARKQEKTQKSLKHWRSSSRGTCKIAIFQINLPKRASEKHTEMRNCEKAQSQTIWKMFQKDDFAQN